MFKKLFCLKNVVNFVIQHNFHTTKKLCETHYDILKLTKNCSTKDIRNSFLKLSKQYHPDKNLQKDTHTSFVKISQAYKVLSNPRTRRYYDLGLSVPNRNSAEVHFRHANSGEWFDESLWQYRDKTVDNFYRSQPYYGIKGVKKFSNSNVVMLCIAFCAIGVSIQIYAIRKSLRHNRNELDQKSGDLAILHSSIRTQALEKGDKKQIELLKQKLNYKEEP